MNHRPPELLFPPSLRAKRRTHMKTRKRLATVLIAVLLLISIYSVSGIVVTQIRNPIIYDDRGLAVRTYGATDVTLDSANLNGEVTYIRGYDEEDVEVYFTWRAEGDTIWNETEIVALPPSRTFSEEINELTSNITYEYRAIALANGDTFQGGLKYFRTVAIYYMVELLQYDEAVIHGNNATINYRVTNLGSEEGTQDITIYIYNDTGTLVHEDVENDITLGASEHYDGVFLWETDANDTCYHNFTLSSDNHEVEAVIAVFETDMDINESTGTYSGNPAQWEDHWVVSDVYVEHLDNMEMIYEYELRGTSFINVANAGVRILVDGDVIMEVTSSGTVSDTWIGFVDVSGKTDVDIRFQYYTESVGACFPATSEVTISQAGYQFVIGKPYFEVTILELFVGKEYTINESVDVSYSITNTGRAIGTQLIEFQIDGTLIDFVEDITLEYEEVYTGIFSWTAEEPFGERQLSIRSENHHYSVNIFLIESDPVFYEVNILEPEQDSIFTIVENVTIEYQVTNTGWDQGNQTLEFRVNGTTIDSDEHIVLDGAEVYVGMFVWSTDEVGEYVLSIHSDDDHHEVNITVTDRLYPVSEISTTNVDGDIEYLRFDPESPEAYEDWYEAINPAQNPGTMLHVELDEPGGELSGTQTIAILVRRTDNSNRIPSLDMILYQNGDEIASLTGVDVSSPVGELFYIEFDATDLDDPTGENMTLHLIGSRTGGAQAQRNTVEYGAVEWHINSGDILGETDNPIRAEPPLHQPLGAPRDINPFDSITTIYAINDKRAIT